MQQVRNRLSDIDVGKGIAIILVVLGHLVARDIKPEGNDWYLRAQVGLYSFHMAFFFSLAGYVFWTAAPEDRPHRVRKAFGRMFPAYVMLALCGFVAKAALARYMPVDHPVAATFASWFTLLKYPTEGFVAFLWFIIALLTLYVLSLAALRLLKWLPDPMLGLTLVAIATHALAVYDLITHIGALHYAMINWVFFVASAWTLRYRERVNPFLLRWWPALIVALGLALAFVQDPLRWTIPALIALPALHGLSLQISVLGGRLAQGLEWLGKRSWPIYLFNTFAIGIAKVVVLRFVGWDGARFFFLMPVLLAAGLLLPIAVQSLLLARIGWLDRVTR